MGVYSSIKAVHRDAMKVANRDPVAVQMVYDRKAHPATLTTLRNLFKGVCDTVVEYRALTGRAKVIKTKLRE